MLIHQHPQKCRLYSCVPRLKTPMHTPPPHRRVIHVLLLEVACGVQLGLGSPCHQLTGIGIHPSQHCIAIHRVNLHLQTPSPFITASTGASPCLAAAGLCVCAAAVSVFMDAVGGGISGCVCPQPCTGSGLGCTMALLDSCGGRHTNTRIRLSAYTQPPQCLHDMTSQCWQNTAVYCTEG
jgi:hypothetical protein